MRLQAFEGKPPFLITTCQNVWPLLAVKKGGSFTASVIELLMHQYYDYLERTQEI